VRVDSFEIGPAISANDRILDASFIFSASLSEAQACLVTAHNAVLVLQFPLLAYSLRRDTNLLRRNTKIRCITASENPLIYSARVRPSPSDSFQVVAGPVFGDILVWSAQLDQNPSGIINATHVGSGHTGATFGVDQLDEWLASCSDDRTVRLGMLAVNAPIQLDNGSKVLGERWSHTSRVWGVKFIRLATDVLGLVSIGEDAFCKVQQISKEGLIELVDDRYHAGKNIWSFADFELGVHQFITGGADGAIVARDVLMRNSSRSTNSQNAFQSLPKAAGSPFDHWQSDFISLFSEIDNRAVLKTGSNAKHSSIKQYLFTSPSYLLALTDSGYLISIARGKRASLDNNQNSRDERSTAPEKMSISSKWSVKRKCEDLFGERPVLSNCEDRLVFVGNVNGALFVCFPTEDETVGTLVTQVDMPISWLAIAAVRHAIGSHRECCVVVYCSKRKEAKIVFVVLPLAAEEMAVAEPSEEPAQQPTSRFQIPLDTPFDTEVKNLDLPEGFEPTRARVLSITKVLVLGSRRSGIAIYRPFLDGTDGDRVISYDNPLHVPNVHGTDAVTSINSMPFRYDSTHCRKEPFLTTGRNGTYAVHKVSVESSRLTAKILDISTSPFISSVEGSYYAITQEFISSSSHPYPAIPFESGQWEFETSGSIKRGDLILYGFDSKKFVVWNESRRSLIFSIDCGGRSRPWAYNIYALTTELEDVNYPRYGPFAWTKVGLLNIVSIGQPDHCTIQQGGHGREIKALSVFPLPYEDLSHGIHSGILVATGAEDTTIRFFAVGPRTETHARNKLILIRTGKKHNTGIQHLSFSSCGRYLFSSGGCEELYAWRIRHHVPDVNLGVLLDYTFPKEAPNSDLRITDFEVQSYHSGTFLVSAVYSNSMVKVFHFKPRISDPAQRCELRQRFFYRTNCLTQIHDHAETGTLTASTDGFLAFWPIGAHALDSPGHYQDYLGGSARGLDNPIYSQPLHENSIQAMRTVDLPSRIGSVHEQLVITGGDDSSLGLTLIRVSTIDAIHRSFAKPQFGPLLIKAAHAAAVTAICLLSMSTANSRIENGKLIYAPIHIRFLSAGNDQRVKLWQATYTPRNGDEYQTSMGGDKMAALEVELLASTDTNVADVAAMELLSGLQGDFVRPCDVNKEYADGPRKELSRHLVHWPVRLPPEAKGIARVLIVGVGMEVLEIAAEKESYGYRWT
jgi:WD40 repeat protein